MKRKLAKHAKIILSYSVERPYKLRWMATFGNYQGLPSEPTGYGKDFSTAIKRLVAEQKTIMEERDAN